MSFGEHGWMSWGFMLERMAFGQVGDSAAKAVMPLVSVNIQVPHFCRQVGSA